MREQVKITKVDEVYIHIAADRGILREFSEEFTFMVPGYKFTPAYKQGRWDGKIRLFSLQTQQIYLGLLNEVKEFCKERDYDVEINYADFAEQSITAEEAYKFIHTIIPEVKIPSFDKEIRPYQLKSFIDCVRNNRLLLLSPTSSGKSFMIYLLIRWYNLKTLVIVDGTGPVHQMSDDFISYGYDETRIHKIFSGQEKDTGSQVTVSTWQSLAKMPKSFFDQFGVIIGDEAHHFQAKSFTDLMHKTTDTVYKFGFTGTIDDSSKCNVLVLSGLFGPVKKIVTTAELMEQKHIADLRIKCIVLQYEDKVKRLLKGVEYAKEMDFIARNTARNEFIKKLAIAKAEKNQNTIIFFQYVEKHGKALYDLIRESTNRPVFFVHGGVKGEIRNDMRAEIEKTNGAIIVASYGTFQTAISINNIHNLIFGSPSKSKIRNLQSIGRGLRKHHSKEYVTLYDIADNLIIGNHKNHTIRHFAERIKIYDSEKFKYEYMNIKLEDN